VTSPTQAGQINALRAALPAMKWHQWDPFSRWSFYQSASLASGQMAEPEYRLERADVIVSLDYDFLFLAPDRLRLTKAFSERRRFDGPDFDHPNSLFVAEPTLSITGSMAQARLPIAAHKTKWLAQNLGAKLNVCAAPREAPEG